MPVFSRLFRPEWESGEDLCSIVILTLDDYFTDIKLWIDEEYYFIFAFQMVCRIVNLYCMALCRESRSSSSSMGSSRQMVQFKSCDGAAHRIVDDARALVEFFDKYDAAIVKGAAILRSKTNQTKAQSAPNPEGVNAPLAQQVTEKVSTSGPLMHETKFLFHLSRVVGSWTEVREVEMEMLALFNKWGLDGRRLVHAAIRSSPQFDVDQRNDMLRRVSNLYAQGQASGSFAAKVV